MHAHRHAAQRCQTKVPAYPAHACVCSAARSVVMTKDEGERCGSDVPVEEMSVTMEIQKMSTGLSTGTRPVDRLADVAERRFTYGCPNFPLLLASPLAHPRTMQTLS